MCYGRRNKKFDTESFVRGYHVYWMLVIGVCEREEGNPRGRYEVAIEKVVT